ncbi:MAG: GYD domain-containing protein [Planctomycetia bacterium]|nr:GYD domain-containing protein [Planctomycetia bacterium]
MATFISTIKFTEKGIQKIHESTKRAAAFKAAAKKMGVRVSGIYWTLGSFDGVIVFDATDDEAATAAMLHLASLGNVQTTTARAFDSTEMEKIVGLLKK